MVYARGARLCWQSVFSVAPLGVRSPTGESRREPPVAVVKLAPMGERYQEAKALRSSSPSPGDGRRPALEEEIFSSCVRMAAALAAACLTTSVVSALTNLSSVSDELSRFGTGQKKLAS